MITKLKPQKLEIYIYINTNTKTSIPLTKNNKSGAIVGFASSIDNIVTIPLPEKLSNINNNEMEDNFDTQKPKLLNKLPIKKRIELNNQKEQNDSAFFKLHAEYNEITHKNNQVKVSNIQEKSQKSQIQDEKFNKMMKHIYITEGGFVNNPHDKGGRTNKGVTQRTFDAYNKKMYRAQKDVLYITKDEADEIYYNEYYKASGADKIEDKNLRYSHYDSAINHGVYQANKFLKESGGDFNKYMRIRKKFYDDIVANKPNQKTFYKGWLNRIQNIQKMKDNNLFDD